MAAAFEPVAFPVVCGVLLLLRATRWSLGGGASLCGGLVDLNRGRGRETKGDRRGGWVDHGRRGKTSKGQEPRSERRRRRGGGAPGGSGAARGKGWIGAREARVWAAWVRREG